MDSVPPVGAPSSVSSTDAIVMTASFKGARTTLDGGWDVTFELQDPSHAVNIPLLNELHGVMLSVVVMQAK